MRRTPLRSLLTALVVAHAATACALPPELERRLAPVERIEVEVRPGTPPAAALLVHGYLPDACTRLGATEQHREGQRIVVLLHAERPAGAICAQVIRPYTHRIELDTSDLPPGAYALEVNGRRERLLLPAPAAL